MRRLIILFALNVFSISLFAQWKKIATIPLTSTVTAVAVDRPGEFYIVDNQHWIFKYDVDGHVLASAKFESDPIVFDPRDGARLFAFFANDGKFVNISPSLSINRSVPVDSSYAIHPFLACSAGDFNLVILDTADWSIRKVNLKTELLMTETILPDSVTASAHFVTMREYQNFIFLLDARRGIQILNSMGKPLKTLAVKGLKAFNFIGEELYYVTGSKMIFFDLFTAETRTVDLPEGVDFALITDERLFTVKAKTIQIYAATP